MSLALRCARQYRQLQMFAVHARHGILRVHFCALPRVAPRTSCVTSICMVQEGWTKVCGDDVGNLHFEYYPQPEDHGTYGKVL